MEKGHYGQYTGNARCCKKTKVTSSNYRASERDDAAHIDYLKRDINYDNKHGHSNENMTADEKHISKLAGDMKYDKEHHGSPAKKAADAGRSGHPRHMQSGADNSGNPNAPSPDEYWRKHQQLRHHQSAPQKEDEGSAAKMISPLRHDREDKKEHLHGRIEKKTGKLKPIINKQTGERLPERLPKKK